MLGTIPISQIVSVKPAVLKAAGAAVDLNGLLLTEDTAVPAGAVKSFASADDVANFFGATSPEAIAAVVYFNGYTIATRTPGILHIAQYNSTPVAAYTRGGSLKGVSLDTVKAVTGSLSVTVDGAQKTAASVNLTGATSFADAATRLSTALSALVKWDAVREAFVISSGTTGNASTISYVTGTAADGLMLSQAKGAEVSQGADAATPKAYMDELVQITQNWALFTTAFEPDLEARKSLPCGPMVAAIASAMWRGIRTLRPKTRQTQPASVTGCAKTKCRIRFQCLATCRTPCLFWALLLRWILTAAMADQPWHSSIKAD